MLDLLTLTPFQRQIYVATFGAYFAAQVHARMESGTSRGISKNAN